VSRNNTRQSSLCQVSPGRHSAKNSKNNLCRVSSRGHSAKTTLSSAPDLALGKAYFKIKKNLCRVPDHEHSTKHSYIAPGQFFFFLTLSLRRALCSTPPPCPRPPLRPPPCPPCSRPRPPPCPSNPSTRAHVLLYIYKLLLI
jgi:hypothetical protein